MSARLRWRQARARALDSSWFMTGTITSHIVDSTSTAEVWASRGSRALIGLTPVA